MTHEPECPESRNLVDIKVDCPCDELRAAYRRGREDAAEAVESATYMRNVLPSGWTDETWRGNRPHAIDRDIAIAAARGDGD